MRRGLYSLPLYIFSVTSCVSLNSLSQTNALTCAKVPLLEATGLCWGMTLTHAQASAKVVQFKNSFGVDQVGLPYVIVEGVDFPAALTFDKGSPSPKELTDQGWKRTYESGLNKVNLSKTGECLEADYIKLKNAFARKWQVLEPERVTGNTELKNRIITFAVNFSPITLFSRCDNPYEEYRWLSIDIGGPQTKL